MAAGKLFLSMLVVSPVYAEKNIPYSMTASTEVVYSNTGQPLEGFANLMRYWNGRLTPEDQQTHFRTILMVLNNAQNGEVGEWYSQFTSSSGQVRVVYTYMAGAGYCRVFQSMVVSGGVERQYQETGCIQQGRNSWLFYNK